MYKCVNCGKEFEKLEFTICAFCRGKVLFKSTPPIAKNVSTD